MTSTTTLGPAGRRLWEAVDAYLVREKLVLDEHEVVVLELAAATADRVDQLGQALTGMDIASNAAAVRLMAEERMQRKALAELLTTKLGLPSGIAAETKDTGRTPRSRRAQKAAAVRWGAAG
ncbi:hypothetical protein GCM10009547_48630 [Sporichthya brevicatena]|uniref:Terminase n=1 Tax=Sporichthya brevicatena TaxID=171442 RepID=A0ABN1HCW0_9ACTN